MTEKKTHFKLAIVDDHNLFRKGLIKLINLADQARKYEVIFEAANGNDLKEKLKDRHLPDIVLMDIDMPDMDGYETVAWLQEHHPGICILVISMFESEETILRMLRLGVSGYLSKDIEVEDMNRALEAIAAKGFYYSDYVAGIMAGSIQNRQREGAVRLSTGKRDIWIDLSENEKEFLRLACTEMTYQQIADKMYLSPKTIDGYREALFGKFQVKSRVSLAMYAVRNGLVKI
ncbi:MAG TPA: response regulator transcription factor [Puia sp.]|nr:response regulator transcription factor [Puia sp.]